MRTQLSIWASAAAWAAGVSLQALSGQTLAGAPDFGWASATGHGPRLSTATAPQVAARAAAPAKPMF
ncbi:MAG: hypothetical protein Q8M96_12820, partial [Rubrivivax sp.]|nr:hypothetical protein [Rubrivivax sp.]